MTHIIGNMLIDQDNSNIIPLSKCLKCVFDNVRFGVLFYYEEVGGVGCSVAYSCEEETGDGVLFCFMSY